MPDKIINPRSPAKWDKRQEGKPSFLEGVHGADAEGNIKPATLTADEKAFLEKRRVELSELANGAGREALTDDDKWLLAQMRDEQFHGDNLIVHGIARNPEQVQFHGLATARALRNLGRFQEAQEIAESLPFKTDERHELLVSISAWAMAVTDGDVDCGCERKAQSYVDTKGPLFKGKHATVTITPNRRHRAERVMINGEIRWLYRCSVCGGLSLPSSMPERHQAVHEARAVVMSAVKRGVEVTGSGDAELLKS